MCNICQYIYYLAYCYLFRNKHFQLNGLNSNRNSFGNAAKQCLVTNTLSKLSSLLAKITFFFKPTSEDNQPAIADGVCFHSISRKDIKGYHNISCVRNWENVIFLFLPVRKPAVNFLSALSIETAPHHCPASCTLSILAKLKYLFDDKGFLF